MGDAGKRHYQRGAHIYPRKLRTGVVFYGYIPTQSGPPERISLETSDPAEADRRLRERLAERDAEDEADVRGTATAALTLAEISVKFLDAPHGWTRRTAESNRARVLAVGDWFEQRGIVYPEQITDQLVDDWTAERRASTTHRTINRDLRAWRVMLEWAFERKLCERCGAVIDRKGLREAKRKRRFVVPSPDEMRAILAKLGEQYDASVILARARMSKHEGGRWPRAGARECIGAIYVTGLRVDELRRLPPEELKSDGRLYMRPEAGPANVAEPGKGHREREIPLAPDAQTIVAEFFIASRASRTVFSESWLVKALHKATDALGIPRCGLHDLRRGFATEMVRSGIDIIVVSRWLGHADVRTTELYLAEYRSDRQIVAPVPRGVRVQTVSNPPDDMSTIQGVSGDRVEGPNASENAENLRSYPSDLNRRPAVYETVGGSQPDSAFRRALHTRAIDGGETPVRGDAITMDALERWGLSEQTDYELVPVPAGELN